MKQIRGELRALWRDILQIYVTAFESALVLPAGAVIALYNARPDVDVAKVRSACFVQTRHYLVLFATRF